MLGEQLGSDPVAEIPPSGQGCALTFVGLLVLAVTVVLTVWLG